MEGKEPGFIPVPRMPRPKPPPSLNPLGWRGSSSKPHSQLQLEDSGCEQGHTMMGTIPRGPQDPRSDPIPQPGMTERRRNTSK